MHTQWVSQTRYPRRGSRQNPSTIRGHDGTSQSQERPTMNHHCSLDPLSRQDHHGQPNNNRIIRARTTRGKEHTRKQVKASLFPQLLPCSHSCCLVLDAIHRYSPTCMLLEAVSHALSASMVWGKERRNTTSGRRREEEQRRHPLILTSSVGPPSLPGPNLARYSQARRTLANLAGCLLLTASALRTKTTYTLRTIRVKSERHKVSL